MIETREQLQDYLQHAVQLEFATIPVYLCALYSIWPGSNREAYQIIRSVVMEEMLHMTNACNVLNAIGGTPKIYDPQWMPSYPTYLPDGEDYFQVNLRPFSQETVNMFLDIEKPSTNPDFARSFSLPMRANPQNLTFLAKGENRITVGEFYERIEEGIRHLSVELGETVLFSGPRERQIKPEYYYNGGGQIIPVFDTESALAALQEIVDQGEGADHSIHVGDEIAHYYRFLEIKNKRFYNLNDTVDKPTGQTFEVEYDKVYKMKENPKTEQYVENPELFQKSNEFNRSYAQMLNTLQKAFTGESQLLFAAVGSMFQLKYKALELLRNPFPGQEEYNAGPTFEYVALEEQTEQEGNVATGSQVSR